MTHAAPAARRPLYKVSVWDHEKQGWTAYATRVGKWRLRKTVRDLRRLNYSAVSFLVERRHDSP